MISSQGVLLILYQVFGGIVIVAFNIRLTRLIEGSRITPYKLCKDTGIAQSQVTNWKKGTKLPSYENIIALAAYFKVSTDFLLGFDLEQELTEQERELLEHFRKLLPYDKKDTVDIVRMKAERVEAEGGLYPSSEQSGEPA